MPSLLGSSREDNIQGLDDSVPDHDIVLIQVREMMSLVGSISTRYVQSVPLNDYCINQPTRSAEAMFGLEICNSSG